MRQSIKAKAYTLFFGTLIGVLVAILGPIRSTIALYFQNQEKEEELLKAQEISNELNQLMSTVDASRTYSSTDSDSNKSLRSELLNRMGELSQFEQLTFRDMGVSSQYSEFGMAIETYVMTFESNFKTAVHSTKYLEDSLSTGNVASVKYSAANNRATRKRELLTKIYVQQVTETRSGK